MELKRNSPRVASRVCLGAEPTSLTVALFPSAPPGRGGSVSREETGTLLPRFRWAATSPSCQHASRTVQGVKGAATTPVALSVDLYSHHPQKEQEHWNCRHLTLD